MQRHPAAVMCRPPALLPGKRPWTFRVIVVAGLALPGALMAQLPDSIHSAVSPQDPSVIYYWRPGRSVRCTENRRVSANASFDTGGGLRDIISAHLKFETRWTRLTRADPDGEQIERLDFAACMQYLQGLMTLAEYRSVRTDLFQMQFCIQVRRERISNPRCAAPGQSPPSAQASGSLAALFSLTPEEARATPPRWFKRDTSTSTQPRAAQAESAAPRPQPRAAASATRPQPRAPAAGPVVTASAPPAFVPTRQLSARVDTADGLWRRHWGAEAIRELEAVVAEAPAYVLAQNNLAWYLVMTGRPTEALPHAIAALEAGGRDVDYVEDTAGYIYALLGEFSRAADFYQAAQRLATDSAAAAAYGRKVADVRGNRLPFEPEIAYSWHVKAEELWQAGRRDEALSSAARAVSIDGEFWQARNDLAWDLAMQGSIADALPHALHALQSGGQNVDYVNDTVAYVYARLGRFADAATYYARAVRLAASAADSATYQLKLDQVRSQRVPIEPEAR